MTDGIMRSPAGWEPVRVDLPYAPKGGVAPEPFTVGNAVGPAHAVPIGQGDGRYLRGWNGQRAAMWCGAALSGGDGVWQVTFPSGLFTGSPAVVATPLSIVGGVLSIVIDDRSPTHQKGQIISVAGAGVPNVWVFVIAMEGIAAIH